MQDLIHRALLQHRAQCWNSCSHCEFHKSCIQKLWVNINWHESSVAPRWIQWKSVHLHLVRRKVSSQSLSVCFPNCSQPTSHSQHSDKCKVQLRPKLVRLLGWSHWVNSTNTMMHLEDRWALCRARDMLENHPSWQRLEDDDKTMR